MRHYWQSQIHRSAAAGCLRIGLSRITGKWCGAILVFAVALSAGTRQTVASVLTNGNVLPADNPFTIDVDEGIPIDGNFIDITVAANQQVTFEGRVDTKGNVDPADDTNVNFDVIVGQTSSGVLLISGESALRDQSLIIGDSGQIGGSNGVMRRGTGVVRVTGFGSLYNNDPAIIPPGLPVNFGSVVPRDPAVGYDLFVGRAGVGTLEITAGGRAEIQDAVVAGDNGGATGTIVVDGVDSYLGSGGFTSAPGSTELHQMVIGHLGTGVMSITNGGQVIALGPDTQAQFVIGAVIGSDPTSTGQPQAFAGGQGTVTVDGVGSKWIVGGTLQVGAFDSTKFTGTPATEDLPGGTVQYPGNAGRGTLYVNNGAVVNIESPTILTGPTTLFLDVVVGLFGQVHLAGGSIQIDNSAIAGAGGGQATPSIRTYRLLNDGMIGGNGTISVGQFRNRALGQVHVAAGEKLVVNSTGQFINPVTDEEPLSNYGLIDVLGTETTRAEIDFIRTPTPVTNGSNELVRQFINFRQATAPPNGGRQVGTIVAQSATLRFLSGIENNGILSFTGGTNIVSGSVDNEGLPNFPMGLVSVAGNGTSVTFEDDFLNESVLALNSQNATVTIDGALTASSSTINMTLGSHISVAGKADLTNAIFNLAAASLSTNDVGDIIPLIFYSDPTSVFAGVSFPIFDPAFFFKPILSPSFFGVQLCSAMNGCTATPGGGLPGIGDADLDNNGIVDANDLAIWRARFGLSGLGDVNGNGIVDAADFTIIRDHFGAAMGAGAGAGAGAAVPEPTSLMLLLTSALLALAARQRHLLAI